VKYVSPIHREAQKVNGAIRAEMILRSQKMSEDTYNGWKNRDTWNVALWIGQDPLYTEAVAFVKDYKGSAPYVDFLESCGLDSQATPDGSRYVSEGLDYPRLNEMMMEFKEH